MNDQQPGFEYRGEFFPWAATQFGGKDMILIDRITGMPLDEFQEELNDETSSMRSVTLLALIAVTVRAKYPAWSPERIYRMILELDMDEVEFIGSDELEEEKADPPADAAETAATSASSSAESSSSATPVETGASETSAATPA